MRLISAIVRHEWQLLRADAVAGLAISVFAALAAIALVLGSTRARLERRDAGSLQARAATQTIELAEQAAMTDVERASLWGPTHPDYVANERGTLVALPPAPLLALSAGQSDVYPDHYRITARLRESQLTGDELENPLMLLTGQLDLTFLAIYLYPLLILGASADLTATERQTGTLRMMLTQAVPLQTLVSAKVLVRAAIVIVVPFAIALASLPIVGTEPATVQRLFLWCAAVLGYGCFWLGVAIVANAFGRSSAAIALTLAGVWLALVVLLPSIGNLTTRLAYPVPSRVEFATTVRAATRDAMLQGSQMLGRFLEDHPSSGTGVEGMQQYALLQSVRDREVAKRAEPLRTAYDHQLSQQRRMMSWLQYASPAILMQLALTDTAGTSGDRHRRFQAQATDFQVAWRAFFEPRILKFEPLTVTDFDRLPSFAYTEEPVAEVVARVALPLAALAAAGGALTGLGLRAYRRYDVTGA